MSVDVVIVNWNGGPEVLAAIESARQFGANVIVVDNASTSGAGVSLESMPGIQFIRNPTNQGFAAASNRGVAAGASDIVLLLNPDAQIIAGTSTDLEQAFADPRTMLVGLPLQKVSGERLPTVYQLPRLDNLVGDLLRLTSVRRRAGMARPSSAVVATGPAPIGSWVVGAALAMRRVDWERLGGIDEGFFLWYEDVDLGARVARAGGRVVVADGLLVRHIGASTWQRLPRRRRQWLRVLGTRRYAANNLGRGAEAAIIVAAPFALAIGVALDLGHWLSRRA